MRRSTTLFLALVATSSILLAACGDTDETTSADMPMSDSGMDGTTDGGMGHDGAMGHDESSPVADGAREVEVTATSFAFDPDEITVMAGEDIAIVLTSDDLLHDFTIDELDVKVAIDASANAVGTFTVEEGTYEFYCSIPGHRESGMVGTLVVG